MSDEVQRVEVITSVQRRRRWSVAEKMRLVEETLQPRNGWRSLPCFCRELEEAEQELQAATKLSEDVNAAARKAAAREGGVTAAGC